jgi:hypothetical protein
VVCRLHHEIKVCLKYVDLRYAHINNSINITVMQNYVVEVTQASFNKYMVPKCYMEKVVRNYTTSVNVIFW